MTNLKLYLLKRKERIHISLKLEIKRDISTDLMGKKGLEKNTMNNCMPTN